MVNGQGSLSDMFSGCQLYVQLLVLLKYLRAAASDQHDPVYNPVRIIKSILDCLGDHSIVRTQP